MKIVAGILLIAASLQPYIIVVAATAEKTSISVETISCFCDYIYDPVCGTDGRTYSNECVLHCISQENIANHLWPIHVHSKSPCIERPCVCPAITQQVCGSDMQTYTNECYFDCENTKRVDNGLPKIIVVHPGPCKRSNIKCPDVIVPVCGTDGKTYKNICELQYYSRKNRSKANAHIRLQSSGACPVENCSCAQESKPVCGSDVRTYDNLCMLDCQNRRREQMGQPHITILYEDQCIDCVCTAAYNPICASDKRTYSNHCALDCENRRRDILDLPPLNGTLGECPCPCPKIYDPYCASDNKTYVNRCQLNCKNGLRTLQGLSPLIINNKKECACQCQDTYDPLCASDGRTDFNQCFLNCENAARSLQGLSSLTILSRGECPCDCPKNYDPLCGNNNRTYGNTCWLDCINDTRDTFYLTSIRKAHSGECKCECPWCSSVNEPVCGSDGKTYLNDCWLDCRNKCNKYTSLPLISLESYGPCKTIS